MKRKPRIISLICAVVLIAAFSFLIFTEVNDPITPEKLMSSAPDKTSKELTEAAQNIYNTTVLSLLPTDPSEGFMETAHTFDQLQSATLSAPIPVFASPTYYAKTDEFKSRLTLRAWDFIVYAEDGPIAVFSLGTKSSGYEYQSLTGQAYAINYDKALRSLGDVPVMSLPVGVYQFLSSTKGKVAVINPIFDDTVHPTVSFADLNAAATRSIYDTIDTPAEYELGAGFNLDYLYNPSSLNDNYQGMGLHQDNLQIIAIVICGAAIIFVGILISVYLVGRHKKVKSYKS